MERGEVLLCNCAREDAEPKGRPKSDEGGGGQGSRAKEKKGHFCSPRRRQTITPRASYISHPPPHTSLSPSAVTSAVGIVSGPYLAVSGEVGSPR